jgi:sigma-B regulation protein RsbU (phosphoserine phosphatase)
MAVAHSIAHTQPEPPSRPGELLTHLNAHLTRQYTRQTGNFMTAFYAVFDPAGGSLTYASAGHNPPRLIRRDGSLVALNRVQRLPLGIKSDETYPEQIAQLRNGDQAVFFTDGVIEAMNRDGEVFGSDRIDSALAHNPASAELLIQVVLRELADFTAGAPVADDRTLLVVRRA